MSQTIYYSAQNVMAEYDTYYAEGYRAIGQMYPTMAKDGEQYLGNQWTHEEITALNEENRHAYTINKTKSKIDWIDGYQIQNRWSNVVIPIQGSSQQTADQLTKCLLYVFDKSRGYRFVSDTFKGGNIYGWNLLNVYLDYTDDPLNGDIRFGRDPFSAFINDPYWTSLNLDYDCNWVIKRKYLSPQIAANLLPGQEDDVYQLAKDGWERDNKFTWMVFQRVPTGQRMMAYNEFYRPRYKDQKVIINKMTKNFVDWEGDPDTYMSLKEMADRVGHELAIITRKKKYMEKSIILNNNYMRTEINPYGLDEYPFSMYAPIFESESPDYNLKVQSLIRQLIDPQKELNRRRSQMIDVVESNLNSGWVEEDGAVKNPKMLYQSGQGKRIVLNKNYKIDSIMQLRPTVVPPSFFQEQNQAELDLMEILGMNPTAFGHVETRQVSAIVEMQRQKAAVLPLEGVFDNLADCQINVAAKCLKLIQGWSPDKIRKIIGDEPTKEFFDKEWGKYHVTVAEGMLTHTQRYMFFRQVMELKQLGEPVPPGYLSKIAPIQGGFDFQKEMAQASQMAQQQQQQAMQLGQAGAQADIQSKQAKAVSDIALSKEREARAIADLGLEDERVAEGIKNREEAAFTHVRSLQEMEKLDEETRAVKDKRLMDMMGFFQQYEQYLKGQEQEEKTENISTSQSLGQPRNPQQ